MLTYASPLVFVDNRVRRSPLANPADTFSKITLCSVKIAKQSVILCPIVLSNCKNSILFPEIKIPTMPLTPSQTKIVNTCGIQFILGGSDSGKISVITDSPSAGCGARLL